MVSDDCLYFFKFKPNAAREAQKMAEKKKSSIAIGKNFESAGGNSASGASVGQLPPERVIPKSKGTYECVLKWRAKEFTDTKILNVSVHDGKGSNESAMVVSTKDGQILVVNLY